MLPLVSKNFKEIVENYPRSEFYSCDHCPREFRTRAQQNAHEGACHIKVGRAEEDDTHYSPANDDGIDEEKNALAVEGFEAEDTVRTVSVFVSPHYILLFRSPHSCSFTSLCSSASCQCRSIELGCG